MINTPKNVAVSEGSGAASSSQFLEALTQGHYEFVERRRGAGGPPESYVIISVEPHPFS
jgi:hypothetical protein